MSRKVNHPKMYFFSDKLKRQLAQIPRYPLTVVEAPSGFGKTTAIKEYLEENLSPGTSEYWYTSLGEPASTAWKGICGLLAKVNDEIAGNLQKLEMPTMDTLLYMTAILRDFHCQTETYLVIDNYQLVNCDIPRELMSVFSMHGNPNLHMIFITQQLAARQLFSIHNAGIHTIDAAAFFFDREGTASLFRMENIRLTDDELESVFMSTDGWVSAIRLQIINFKETGSFDYTADIEQLVENAIWKRLSPEEKEFLLSVSVMDSFDARQAAIMIGQETLPDHIEDMLKSNDFIKYFPDKSIYTMHSILQDYLRNRFYHHQPKDFQERILHLAGQSYAAISQFYTAAQFFIKVKDFEAILSIPFDVECLANQREKDLQGYIKTLVNECPEETLCKYPVTMLILAYPMLFERQMEIFARLCRLIGLAIEKNQAGLSQEELRRLKGEFTFLTSFTTYNDIKKMNEGRRAALETLGGPSSIIVKDMPWAFGGVSALLTFWRESGKLEDTLRDMDECLPSYLKLTGGQGVGANSLMRAEAMLMRGQDNEAEILCHKALYDASNYRQASICICAELVLARIAILRGDVDGYFAAVKNIQSHAKENSNLYVLRMADLAMSMLSLILGTADNVAKWVCNMQSIQQTLYPPAIPYAQTLYSMILLFEKRYNEFLGISQQIMDAAKSMHYLMPQIYQLKYLAAVKLMKGNEPEALAHFKEALTIALPDKIYLPFAQQMNSLDVLLKSGSRSLFDRENLNAIVTLSKRQEKGVKMINKAIRRVKSPLTPREREIAQLARNRLSAKEIADKLYISETTVRTILRSVYSKLDIHSKTELNLKEF